MGLLVVAVVERIPGIAIATLVADINTIGDTQVYRHVFTIIAVRDRCM
jgi:hypothetical protein